jgi:hypothetical protein
MAMFLAGALPRIVHMDAGAARLGAAAAAPLP